MALRPTFTAAEVARQRGLRLAEIFQSHDDPDVVGALTFNAVVYPTEHPYHRPLDGDSASTMELDSAVVRQFYNPCVRALSCPRPDYRGHDARGGPDQVGRSFGAWHFRPEPPRDHRPGRPGYPASDRCLPGRQARRRAVGDHRRWTGPGPLESDYYAVEVMNTILGGRSSRLNDNLREKHGYVYHARSVVVYRPLPGPIMALADVHTDVTDRSLVQIFGNSTESATPWSPRSK